MLKKARRWVKNLKDKEKVALLVGVIGALGAVVVVIFKASGGPTLSNRVSGTSNQQNSSTLIQGPVGGGNGNVLSAAKLNAGILVQGTNAMTVYASGSSGPTTVNQYFGPHSNDLTAVIGAFESKLAAATNSFELTRNDIRQLADALKVIDRRTSGIKVLPDGRTRIGGVITGSPREIMELTKLGDGLRVTNHNYQAALDRYQEALALAANANPSLGEEYDGLLAEISIFAAESATRVYRLDLALTLATNAVRYDPKNALAQSTLVAAYINLKQSNKAREALQAALLLNPTNAELLRFTELLKGIP